MELITKVLFGIANSLLVPDIVLLILFFLRALLILGTTYNGYMVRRRNNAKFNARIKALTPEGIDELRSLLPKKPDSMFTAYLKDLLESGKGEDYADYMLTRYEIESQRDISSSRLLTKLGPILGLVGTLICMGPALVILWRHIGNGLQHASGICVYSGWFAHQFHRARHHATEATLVCGRHEQPRLRCTCTQ